MPLLINESDADDSAPYQVVEVPAEEPRDYPCHSEKQLEARRLMAQAYQEMDQRNQYPAWPLESTGAECFYYPLRAMPLILGLAFAMASVGGLGILFPVSDILDVVLLAVGQFLVGSFVFCCLRRVLQSGLMGDSAIGPWRGWDLGEALRSGVLFLGLGLVGPIFPVAVALWFWLHSGTLIWVDYLILWELAFLGVGYWFLVFLTAQLKKLRQAHPVGVLKLIRRLGHPPLTAALLGSAVVLFHGYLALAALETMATHFFRGWLLLAGCWASLLFWLFFLFRWVGIWVYAFRKNALAAKSG